MALPQNEAQEVFGYELIYREIQNVEQPHRTSKIAVVDVLKDGKSLGSMRPRDNTYLKGNMAGQSVGTPAVRSGFKEDLYLTLLRTDDDQGVPIASVRVIVQPMMKWLWVGGLLMVAGGLIAAWPKGRRGAA